MREVFNLKMPKADDRILVEAECGYDARHGDFYIERGLKLDGVEMDLLDLTSSMRRWLRRDLKLAKLVIASDGSIDCPHGRYLLREFCIDCLVSAKHCS